VPAHFGYSVSAESAVPEPRERQVRTSACGSTRSAGRVLRFKWPFTADFVEKVRGCRGAVVLIQSGVGIGVLPMMGDRWSGEDALFYEFSLGRHVPAEHLLRSIDRFVDLDGVRCELAPFYSEIGRPSIGFKPNVTLLV